MSAPNPSYMSRATLANALDIAESTVDDFVKRGILPRPIKLSPGCVRWSWEAVRVALDSLADTGSCKSPSDPFLAGVENVATSSSRRGSVAA
jgi:predicted DNA-binding transcriptional regulator AlpA